MQIWSLYQLQDLFTHNSKIFFSLHYHSQKETLKTIWKTKLAWMQQKVSLCSKPATPGQGPIMSQPGFLCSDLVSLLIPTKAQHWTPQLFVIQIFHPSSSHSPEVQFLRRGRVRARGGLFLHLAARSKKKREVLNSSLCFPDLLGEEIQNDCWSNNPG